MTWVITKPGPAARSDTPHFQGMEPPTIPGSFKPPACSCCGADLSGAAVIGTEVRQVIDLPATPRSSLPPQRTLPPTIDRPTTGRPCHARSVVAPTRRAI